MQALNKFQDEVNGPLCGGDPGRRLIEPQSETHPPWPVKNITSFAPKTGEWLIVPFHHIFGSEELSVLSPGIASRAPAPYVALGPEDFSALELAENQTVELVCGDGRFQLPARLEPTLPRGLAGVPRGLPDLPGPGPGPAGHCRIAKGNAS